MFRSPTLVVCALLAASGVAAAGAPTPIDAIASHGGACTPASCALARPSVAESVAIHSEAERLVQAYAADTSLLGRQCHALGRTMQTRETDVRMIDFMWRVPDPDGNLAPVTGDAHTVEQPAGTGIVHIARGYNALNPDRGMPAILQTARHEFAHLTGAPQAEGGFDAAAQLATACAPPGSRP